MVHLFYEVVLYFQVSGYQQMNPLKENYLCNLLTLHKLNLLAIKHLEEFTSSNFVSRNIFNNIFNTLTVTGLRI